MTKNLHRIQFFMKLEKISKIRKRLKYFLSNIFATLFRISNGTSRCLILPQKFINPFSVSQSQKESRKFLSNANQKCRNMNSNQIRFYNRKLAIVFYCILTQNSIHGWPTRGPMRNFCSPKSNRESVIFRFFGCISLVFCCIVAQKVSTFGKFSKLRPKYQFGLATSALSSILSHS